ncbi:replicative DNA helicase [Thermodesulfitimonas autotrophica]|uniref:Replicative DNA helicase n=1 Tax=Thermodesulfitimonas autotrophica TaxID=1894989 RepID=A0A3N5AAW3_9THEO|nr:DnaB-like helicase C-terminal domain-containing protein [Thermodesulfitimonas autotrophica]RPF41986.1 replicative DNA helicase [Thermodesulfitimonas autotrophica]
MVHIAKVVPLAAPAAVFTNPDLEARVLRALAQVGEEEFYRLSDYLSPACFPCHGEAFAALADAVAEEKPVPPGAVPQVDVPAGFDLDAAVAELAELARKRLAAEALEAAWRDLPALPADQVFLRVQEALQRAEEAVQGLTAGRLVTLADAEVAAEMDARVREVADAVARTGRPVPWPPLGLRSLDRATGGVQPGAWVLAGREGTSKTHFALWLANRFLEVEDTAVVYVTAEEPPWRMRLKLICIEGRLNWYDYASRGTGDVASLSAGRAKWDAAKGRRFAVIEVTENTTMAHIRAKAKAFQKRLSARHVMVVIDYLQALAHVEAGATQEKWLQDALRHRIDRVSRQAVLMANKEGWTVICVAALNREGDTRESGQVNYDCDLYLQLEWPPDKDPRARENEQSVNMKKKDLRVRKNRYTGWTGVIRLEEWRDLSIFTEEGDALGLKPDFDLDNSPF